MTPDAEKRAIAPTRWFHWLALGAMVMVAAGSRFSGIGKQSLWLDEYWAVYLASGRENPAIGLPFGRVLEAPHGVILDPPPMTGFDAAPPWWRVWNGLHSVVHPPGYYLLLRAWVDLWGDGDGAMRSLSAFISLAGVVALFLALRPTRGPWNALLAAGLLAMAVPQIDFSQETRPYTLIVLLGIACCGLVLSIQRHGLTRWRWVALGLTVFLLGMTHYLSIGGLAGVMVYAMIQLGPETRKAVLGITLGCAVLIGLIWGPFFWAARSTARGAGVFTEDPHRGAAAIPYFLLLAPQRLVFTPGINLPRQPLAPSNGTIQPRASIPLEAWPSIIGLALLVYGLPLIRAKRRPDGLLWWSWMAGSLGVMALLDVLAADRRPAMLGLVRYDIVASGAVYAILSTPLGKSDRARCLIPGLIMLCAIVHSVARVQNGKAPEKHWREMAQLIQRTTAPDDLLIFTECDGIDPAFNYIAFRHYAPQAMHPILFLTDRADQETIRQISSRPRIWLVGDDPTPQSASVLPGWKVGMRYGYAGEMSLWTISPPG